MAVTSFVFVGASEWLVRTKVAPNQNIEAHAHYLRTATRQGAAFGDSHVAMGITGDPRIANLGYPADPIPFMVAKARLYFTRVRPKWVILQADPQQIVPGRLNRTFEQVRSMFDGSNFLEEYLKLSVPIYRNNIIDHWKSFLRGSKFRRVRTFNPTDGSQTATSSIAGWPEQRILTFTQRILEDQINVHIETGHTAIKEYRRLIDWLKARGASVCLVAYPVHPLFLREARKHPTESAARSLFQRIAKAHSVRFVDLRNPGYGAEYFYDPDHLNLAGARRFTRTVMKACFGKSAAENDGG